MSDYEGALNIAGESQMVAFGERLGQALSAGVLLLSGGLGAGKTTLCRGILRSFGYGGAVKSPTYTLVEPYQLDHRCVYHFDLYRLGDPEELEYMGIRDYFEPENLCIVEWPEKGQGILPDGDLRIEIAVAGDSRNLTIIAMSTLGQKALDALKSGTLINAAESG